MIANLHLILVILALLCFALCTLGVASGRISLLALGLFCWLLTETFVK
jgi:hypothetical protein